MKEFFYKWVFYSQPCVVLWVWARYSAHPYPQTQAIQDWMTNNPLVDNPFVPNKSAAYSISWLSEKERVLYLWECKNIFTFKHQQPMFENRSAAVGCSGKSFSGCRGADKLVPLSDPFICYFFIIHWNTPT